eukprot:4379671-Pleurochrysis_carterae.AAC.1
MSNPSARFPTDITWTYKGGFDSDGTELFDEHNRIARVGDSLIDDVLGTVVLLGRTQQRDLTVRRLDGEIMDRTAGHLKCNDAPAVAEGRPAKAAVGDGEVQPQGVKASEQEATVSATEAKFDDEQTGCSAHD